MGTPSLNDTRAARLRSDRQLQIVETAKRVFAEHGYHNASVSEIIDRAGIARGTFYLYFSNKRKVFDAILGEALDQLAKRITVICVDADAPSPHAQLQANLVDVLSYLLDDRPLTQLLLNHGLTPDAESAARVEAFYAHVTAMIQSSLERGIAMGLVRPCDTQLVAAGLFGTVRGIVSHMLGLDQPDVAALAQELLAFTLGGVLVPSLWAKAGAPAAG